MSHALVLLALVLPGTRYVHLVVYAQQVSGPANEKPFPRIFRDNHHRFGVQESANMPKENVQHEYVRPSPTVEIDGSVQCPSKPSINRSYQRWSPEPLTDTPFCTRAWGVCCRSN